MKRRFQCIRVIGQLALVCALAGVALARSTVAAGLDIVLYASDVSHLTGFTLEADPTAAGGWKLSSRDEAWSSTEQPPAAASAPTASFVFDVPEAGNYRMWLRLRGTGNSKFNESVWVQFSHATRSGSAAYRWGTTNGLLVNLENCSNCGIQAWGWQDNSWWLQQSSLVTLPAGAQYLYVAVREDGVELDQIVLSPDRFLNTAPGPVKNDNTMLAKSTNERITITSGTLGTFRGTPTADFQLRGTNQFFLSARVSASDGGSGALVSCTVVAGCPADTQVPFKGDWAGLDIHNPVVSYRGTSYDTTGLNARSTISLVVSGFVKTPSGTGRSDGDVERAEAAFHFGSVLNYTGSPGQPTGRALLVGGGRVGFEFTWSQTDSAWYLREASFIFAIPGSAPPVTTEIVLYAADVTTMSPGMSFVHDATAAEGLKISSANSGRQWLDAPPQPNVAPYTTFSFDVIESGAYRVWLRLKGQGNSKFNESVWVQFSNATRTGANVYTWGSTSGLLVNLENCSNCGIQEWGWQDNSWWLNQSSVVELPRGTQVIYVTVREDGVEFDQIVLSRERYVTAPPGPVKNDTTIVPLPVHNLAYIEQGQITGRDVPGHIDVSGTDGFGLLASMSATYRNVYRDCATGNCFPGGVFPLNTSFSGGDLQGTATWRGETFSIGDAERGFAGLRLTGSVPMPPAGNAPASVVVPFAATGTVMAGNGSRLLDLVYRGNGNARFDLVYDGQSWRIQHLEFVFSRD